MKFIVSLLLLFIISHFCILAGDEIGIKFNAYVDSYIATDDDANKFPWDDKVSGTKLRKLSSVNYYKDEFALNIAQIGAKLLYMDKSRAAVVFQTGTLPEFAYSNSNRNIQQAWAGFRIYGDIWIDAGYFLTHIGGDAYLPKDNWFSSHSLVKYFEPFYQSGIKAAYEGTKVNFHFSILNGSGIFEDNNANKSYGAYLSYFPNPELKISYAGLYGNEQPGSLENAKLQMFHNFCVEAHPDETIGLKAQLDYATLNYGTFDEDSNEIDGSFLGFSVQARYRFFEKFSASVRFAYFSNSDNIFPVYDKGFDGMGLTVSTEYKPSEMSYVRLESRILSFKEGEEKLGYPGRIFYDGKEYVNFRNELMLNFGVWFE